MKMLVIRTSCWVKRHPATGQKRQIDASAKEYGISATYEEYKAYTNEIKENGSSLSPEELSQVAGGSKNSGFGINLCYKVGIGLGGVGDDGGICIGLGADDCGACFGEGAAVD